MKPFLFSLLVLAAFVAKAQSVSQYLVGYGKEDITYVEEGLGLFGYGEYHQRISESDPLTSKIYARVISIREPESDKLLLYLHADLGAIFHPVRRGLVEKIKAELFPNFNEAGLMMTASHTHCAPAGMSEYALYMSSAPGYNPQLVAHTINKMFDAVKEAMSTERLSLISIKEGVFAPEVPIAFNRALKAYNKNPDIKSLKRAQSNLAINRNMPLMSFENLRGESEGFINWFGVHPIEVMGDHNYIESSSKGRAAIFAEENLNKELVAIFAQSSAGDVMTSDYHNKKKFEKQMLTVLDDPEYKHEVSSLNQARWNGEVQAEKALEIRAKEDKINVSGAIDFELIYLDFSNIAIDPKYAYGNINARTASPVLGTSFLAGEFYWRDLNLLRFGLNKIYRISKTSFDIQRPFMQTEKRAYRDTLYECQYPKNMVINGEEKSVFGFKFENYEKRGATKLFLNSISDQDVIIKEVIRELGLGALKEHTILPQVLPVQIVRIGNIIIAGLPTEITTVAYNRLQQTLLEVFENDGVDMVLISSYANAYAGYTTTSEEYMEQRYEGGHTLYGRYQLGAFQTVFEKLGKEMLKPVLERDLDRTKRPPVFSEEELKLRTNLPPFKIDP